LLGPELALGGPRKRTRKRKVVVWGGIEEEDICKKVGGQNNREERERCRRWSEQEAGQANKMVAVIC
jgi:hypothetical protein